ncbi:MAG: hypothetical protein EA350_07610 [Gemmatimonadales bacterium]|nr:MAG: hypothetical protein EA350_07610 [Gemmatimonadales bacterium]
MENFLLFAGIFFMIAGVVEVYMSLPDRATDDHAPDSPEDPDGRSHAEVEARSRREWAYGLRVILFGLIFVIGHLRLPGFVLVPVLVGIVIALTWTWIWAARAGRTAQARKAAPVR